MNLLKNEARPFLKWAGGKGKLLTQYERYYPQDLEKGKIKRYVEPFLGGGAVFFSLQRKYDFDEIVLNDIDADLILTYKVVQNKVDELIRYLSNLETRYLEAEMELKQEIYYEQRNMFNIEKDTIDYNRYTDKWIGHAARMIFLNRTCFNGLYRQNKKGKFNVPFGKRKKVTICDSDNLKEVSKALNGVLLVSKDFEELTEYIDENTFVYMDPPYRPISKTSSFTDYSKVPFDDESQKRLANWVELINRKGAVFMLSNSDPTNVDENDNFFDDLYKKFNINRVHATREINSKGSGRGKLKELLITNKK